MSVKIRLRRIGRKKQPYYRLVVTESTSPRDGAYLDTVGFYNPKRQPAELRLDLEKVEAWTGRGAEMTPTVRSLVSKARRGGDSRVELVTVAPQAEAPTAATSLKGTPDRLHAPSAQPEAAPEPSPTTEPAPPVPGPERAGE